MSLGRCLTNSARRRWDSVPSQDSTLRCLTSTTPLPNMLPRTLNRSRNISSQQRHGNNPATWPASVQITFCSLSDLCPSLFLRRLRSILHVTQRIVVSASSQLHLRSRTTKRYDGFMYQQSYHDKRPSSELQLEKLDEVIDPPETSSSTRTFWFHACLH
jgi:hypothetical protein